MMKRQTCFCVLLVALALTALGCRSGMPSTEFTNPRFDFSYVERAAVLPFENFTSDRQAGFRATRLLVTELLASGALDVVEPGEVRAALERIGAAQVGRSRLPNTSQIVALGSELGVQAVFLGSVNQSETMRSGSVLIPVVTLDLHMVEAETGSAVWAGTHTETGGTVGARVLGTAAEPLSETTRHAIRRLLRSLFD